MSKYILKCAVHFNANEKLQPGAFPSHSSHKIRIQLPGSSTRIEKEVKNLVAKIRQAVTNNDLNYLDRLINKSIKNKQLLVLNQSDISFKNFKLIKKLNYQPIGLKK